MGGRALVEEQSVAGPDSIARGRRAGFYQSLLPSRFSSLYIDRRTVTDHCSCILPLVPSEIFPLRTLQLLTLYLNHERVSCLKRNSSQNIMWQPDMLFCGEPQALPLTWKT